MPETESGHQERGTKAGGLLWMNGDRGDAGDRLSGDLREVQPGCERYADIAARGQHRWSTRVLQLEIVLEPRPSPESALCLGFPICKVSKITRKCWKRAGA